MGKWPLLMIACLLLILTGCSGTSAQQQGGEQMDYQQTKKMMIDVLKTDDGKKAIEDIMSDDKTKQKILMNQEFVKKTIQETLTSKQGKAFWKSLIKDPKFSQTLAKTMTQENKKTLKALMKDPNYQGMMMNILKDPEMEKEYLDLMKSKAYREQVQKVMTEALQSPLFQKKLESILKQVVDEELKKGNSGGQNKSQEGSPS